MNQTITYDCFSNARIPNTHAPLQIRASVVVDTNSKYNIIYYDTISSNRSIINRSNLELKSENLNELYTLFPNPASDELFLNFQNQSESISEIKIYNTLGLLVKILSFSLNQNGGNYTLKIPLLNLINGSYLIELVSDKNKYYESIIILK